MHFIETVSSKSSNIERSKFRIHLKVKVLHL